MSSAANQRVYAVTDTLADSVFNLPLTLKMALPQGWAGGEVSQESITTQAATRGDTTLFEAVPDRGQVTARNASAAFGSMRGSGAYLLSMQVRRTEKGIAFVMPQRCPAACVLLFRNFQDARCVPIGVRMRREWSRLRCSRTRQERLSCALQQKVQRLKRGLLPIDDHSCPCRMNC